MPKTILICNQKGGVGKTLLADELAFAFEREAIPFSFYDLDGQGGTLHPSVKVAGAQVQIIDTPGALQKDLTEWIQAADFIVVPTLMSNRDLAPLERMIQILEPYSQGPQAKPVLYVLNRVNRFKIAQDFQAWFHKNYPHLKTFSLSEATAFNQASAYGLSLVEFSSLSTVLLNRFRRSIG